MHRPLIRFLGKRSWAAAHPTEARPVKKPVFQHSWEAPSRLHYKHLSDKEIDAISSGGASLH